MQDICFSFHLIENWNAIGKYWLSRLDFKFKDETFEHLQIKKVSLRPTHLVGFL
jgi:hypothetical protein